MRLIDADRDFWEQVAARWCGGAATVNTRAIQAAAAKDTTQMAVGLEQHQTRKAIPTALDALLDSDDDDSSDDDW